MCGRYVNLTPPEAMRRLFDITVGPLPSWPGSNNCAPTQMLPVVRRAGPGRALTLMRWGLVPAWSEGPERMKFATFNARAETVAEKPAFRAAFRARRCLVPVDGFYEWRKEGKRKQPYLFTLADHQPMALAGLWECWKATLESFTVIVTEANAVVAPYHDRMPVILARDAWDAWLNPADPAAARLLQPFAADAMTVRPQLEPLR